MCKPQVFANVLDNCIHIMRRISQKHNLENLVMSSDDGCLMSLIFKFISDSGNKIESMGLVGPGILQRPKLCTNYCVLVETICQISLSILDFQKFAGLENTELCDGNFVPVALRKYVVTLLDFWGKIVMEYLSGGASLPQKGAVLIGRLQDKIGCAMSQIMQFGSPFTLEETPFDFIQWLGRLEAMGYRVLYPNVLAQYKEAVTVSLSAAYAGHGSKFCFTEVIFQQLLPKLKDTQAVFLNGNIHRIDFIEDFLSSVYSLSRTSKVISPHCTYPDQQDIAAMNFRQNLGSFLFFGLFQLHSEFRTVRYRALGFLRALLQRFHPKPGFEVDVFLQPYMGLFQSSFAGSITPKVIELSTSFSGFFPVDCTRFILEASLCTTLSAINTQLHTTGPFLQIVIGLITPWCRHLDFRDMCDGSEITEVHRFLVAVHFQTDDKILDCWTQAASSPLFGEGNAAVFLDTTCQVFARSEISRDKCVYYACQLLDQRPELVAAMLVKHLSAEGCPWKHNPNIASTYHRSRDVIRDTLNVVHIPGSGDPIPNSKSVAGILTHLLAYKFDPFRPYIAIILNFFVCHLGGILKGDSAENQLFSVLLQGYIGWLHSERLTRKPEFERSISGVTKVLGWLEMEDCYISWEWARK